jgi:phosphoribosyl 1,2-cyclic phosphodiesterase
MRKTMALRFTVLASGSAGNASLIQSNGFGVLLDAGLGPRQLAARLARVGASWSEVHAVVLTHTHGDHWRDATFAHLHRRSTPFYCHQEHQLALLGYSVAFGRLRSGGLVRTYLPGETIELAPGFRCRPFPVRHDGGPTFGFRFEAATDLFGEATTLAYAADLGSWCPNVVHELAGADLVALEFNHDVVLERCSGRSPALIARVLGDRGHLSNDQAAALVREILQTSHPRRPRHLVQLHLSRDCNRPALAAEVASAAIAACGHEVEVLTAGQDDPTPTVEVGCSKVFRSRAAPRRVSLARSPRGRSPAIGQSLLPGLEA